MSPSPPLDIVEGIVHQLYHLCIADLCPSQHYCSLSAPCRPALGALAPFLRLRLVSSAWDELVTNLRRDEAARSPFFAPVEAGVYYPHKWHINTRLRQAVVLGRYRVFRTINSEQGDRGVYVAYDLENGCAGAPEVILKAWVDAADFELKNEDDAYAMLEGAPGIPRALHAVRWDRDCDVHVLPLPKLGPTLEDLVEVLPGRRMDERMVLTVAIQMLDRCREIHAKQIIHCGIKPANVCIAPRGSVDSKDMLYAIDFGFSISLAENLPMPSPKRTDAVGNRRFMSVMAHHGISQSQKDDLESLAYLLSFLYHGQLPWDRRALARTASTASRASSSSQEVHQPHMWRLKIATPASELFCDMDPCFFDFWNEVKGLAYGEAPDYDKMTGWFKARLEGEPVDWWVIWDHCGEDA